MSEITKVKVENQEECDLVSEIKVEDDPEIYLEDRNIQKKMPHEFSPKQELHENVNTGTIDEADSKLVQFEIIEIKEGYVKEECSKKDAFVGTQAAPLKCDACNTEFTRKGDLKRHFASLTCLKRSLFQCQQCPKAFINQDQLRSHVRYQHLHDCTCSLCGKVFSGQNFLRQHKFKCLSPKSCKENGSELYKCHLCFKMFNMKDLLLLHLDFIHNMPKQAEKHKTCIYCQQCPKYFKNDELLKRHMKRSHQGRKEKKKLTQFMFFDCIFCGKLFDSKMSLIEHEKIQHQEGRDLYKCHICFKKIKFRDLLVLHLEVMHNIKFQPLKTTKPMKDHTFAHPPFQLSTESSTESKEQDDFLISNIVKTEYEVN